MAKFVFELEPLLEQRRREERDRMRAVGEVERERLELEAEAARVALEIRAERQALRAELHGQGPGAVDLRRVQMQANASLHGGRRTQELALRAAAVFKRLDTARALLLRATTQRRAVELLRERRFEAWLAEQRAKEARELDELVTARYGRPSDGAAA
jgi:flagellar FliJ protein